MSPTVVPLVETATGAIVAATLFPSLTPGQVIAAELQWAPHRRAAPESAEHSHWNWALKVGLLARPGVRGLGIDVGGEMQGMMMTVGVGRTTRLDPDRG